MIRIQEVSFNKRYQHSLVKDLIYGFHLMNVYNKPEITNKTFKVQKSPYATMSSWRYSYYVSEDDGTVKGTYNCEKYSEHGNWVLSKT